MTENPVAVVVAYGAVDHLDRCLAALDRRLDVLIVDNSSSADIRQIATSRGAAYLDSGRNIGFAAAVNLALAHFGFDSPRDVLLLNPDVVLKPPEVEELVAHLRRPGNERVAVVAPRLIGEDGVPERVEWPFPSPRRAWLEAIGLGRVRSRRTFVVGAVLLVRGAALRDVGPFDERFFLYAEEADWQRRAVERGWTAAKCTAAVARHVGAATSSDPRRRELLFHAAQETYIRKWFGRSGWLLYRTAAILGAAVRVLLLGGERRADAGRRAALYFRGPRRCAAIFPE